MDELITRAEAAEAMVEDVGMKAMVKRVLADGIPDEVIAKYSYVTVEDVLQLK